MFGHAEEEVIEPQRHRGTEEAIHESCSSEALVNPTRKSFRTG